jgi:hypothetical protein
MRNDDMPGAEFLYTVRGRGAGNFTGEKLLVVVLEHV